MFDVLTKDRYRLARQKKIIDKISDSCLRDQKLKKWHADYNNSKKIVELNRALIPNITDYGNLPISARWHEITELIQKNQVSIIAGHTGSGKTTKIPQICFSVGLGSRGKIAHTQPRRIAARSTASRIAEELNTDLGQITGYRVRFDEVTSPNTRLILVTDGLLLTEIQRDRFLSNYEVIIIDEAHERSLNIDFLLGYIKSILPKRPDLKLIITSATIDTKKFSRHFKDAPILTVEGKTYPITTIYQQSTDGDSNLSKDIKRAIHELDMIHYGDTLIFLPTEREIRSVYDELSKLKLNNTDILMLFARQTAKIQNSIFHPANKRRIILSTNIAETSVTVPRILNVIDSGLARISRYSYKSKIQRLPIEAISRASADQRRGRCGRIAPGVCMRLYSEDDFNTRSEYTEPEIQRTSLASVILQMTSLKIGNITNFPFIDAPPNQMISDGYKLLYELKAVNEERNITNIGSQMAKFPIDPRFSAILITAKKWGCEPIVLPIIAALTIADIKERPKEKEQYADTQHRIFAHQKSDFLFYYQLFILFYPVYKSSKNKARKFCKEYFLSFPRSQEWIYLIEQLAEIINAKYIYPGNTVAIDILNQQAIKKTIESAQSSFDYQQIHTCLAVGFLDHIGILQAPKLEYLGARNKKFHIFPGSFLFKRKPKQIFAAEIVESSRIYARQVADIQLSWLENIAKHLIKTNEFAPHWSKSKGSVIAKQTVLLYGLPLLTDRRVQYAHYNPKEAHDIFIRHALVLNDIKTSIKEIAENKKQYDSILMLEEKSRSRNIVIDENKFADLYFDKIPDYICSSKTLETWYNSDQAINISFKKQQFYLDDSHDISVVDYPNDLSINQQKIKLNYTFDPASDYDGITADIQLSTLNSFQAKDFDYLVPAMLDNKIEAIIKSLPKRYRRQLVPIANTVSKVRDTINQHEGEKKELIDHIISSIKCFFNINLKQEDFATDKIDKYFHINFKIIDSNDKVIDQGRDLKALQDKYKKNATKHFKKQTSNLFAETFYDQFPSTVEPTYVIKNSGITSYLALIKEKDYFKIALFDNEKEADYQHKMGVASFLKKKLAKEISYLDKNILNKQKLSLLYKATSTNNLIDDITNIYIINNITNSVPRDQNSFNQIIQVAKKDIILKCNDIAKILFTSLEKAQKIRQTINKDSIYYQDVSSQLSRLIHNDFLNIISVENLESLPRYLSAIQIRIDKAKQDPKKDLERYNQIKPYIKEVIDLLDKKPISTCSNPDIVSLAYLLEELRISIFAQGSVAIPVKVSIKRLEKSITKVKNNLTL